MSFEEVKLVDSGIQIIDGDRGKNYPKQDDFYSNEACLFLNAKNVTSNGFEFNETSFITREKDAVLRKGKLERLDVVLTTRGTVGNVAYYSERIPYESIRINSGMVILRADRKFYPDFIYWMFRSNYIQDQITAIRTGSAQPQLPITIMRNMQVLKPPLPEQRAIADTLSALDDKIEINNRINKTLEEMAQALFKQWFVDFEFPDENGLPYKSSGGEMEESELGLIPKGWKVGELDQVIEIYDSQRIPLAGNVRSGRKGIYPYYGAASIMDYIDTWIFDGIYLLLAEDGSVVTANDGPVLQYACGKFWVNNHAHVLQGKNGFSVEQLLLLLQRVNVRPYITGAVQLKINQANLKRIPVVIPTQDICLNFNKVIEKQFAMIRDNINETNILGILRDALLPKLMSGEIRVAIEEVAADV